MKMVLMKLLLIVVCCTGQGHGTSYGPVSPTPVCEFAADCALVNCSPGIAVDENGCPLRDCPCQDSIDCPAVVGCDIECPDVADPVSGLPIGPAYKKDANGCVKCECDCSNVPIIANDCNLGCSVFPESCINCPNGNIVNACGGLVSCQCAGCPEINLGIKCEFGRRLDAKGCPTNECNTPPCEFTLCYAVDCLPQYGLAFDKNMCPIRGCPCHGAADCPVVDGCDCPPGFTLQPSPPAYRRDSRGCIICGVCVPPLTTTMAPSKPGSCPRFGGWGRTDCHDDYDCPKDQKCCQKLRNKNGKVCMRPWRGSTGKKW